tara:strand:- start:24164 stop:24466 length:303 start_codon:yes stop_codon:yes gene_type:complete
MSDIMIQEIYYKLKITHLGIESLKDTFADLFIKLKISDETETTAIMEITDESSAHSFYTPMRIKRRIKDQLYSKALHKIESIESLDFKEEAEIYGYGPGS